MENVVTMRLEDYDELRNTIVKLKHEIKEMEDNRVKELKNIFQLDPSYNGVSIYVDATQIIKDLYGEQLQIKETGYELRDEKVTSRIWEAYREVKPEVEDGE